MAEPQWVVELAGDRMEDVEAPGWADVEESVKALDG
ncbi:MAG: hypothetical protein QOH84_5155 [Kribbellaceae bacterium]|jgi:hypothetical protein|nr:hypothetical protein [Kribbellaceae bacterium]